MNTARIKTGTLFLTDSLTVLSVPFPPLTTIKIILKNEKCQQQQVNQENKFHSF